MMNEMNPEPETRIALFQCKEVRRTIHNNEWWFVIVDVVAALTDSADPQGYVKNMRRRDPELAKGWGQIATPLALPFTTAGGYSKLSAPPRLRGSRFPQASPGFRGEDAPEDGVGTAVPAVRTARYVRLNKRPAVATGFYPVDLMAAARAWVRFGNLEDAHE